MSETITLMLPLPPKELRANNRANRWAKKRAADEYADAVAEAWQSQAVRWVPVPPWARANVTYTWRYCGPEPDQGNIGASTKTLQDILCVAPKLGVEQAAKYKRWHLGIVENDKGITATYATENVKHKRDEGVVVRIELKGQA